MLYVIYINIMLYSFNQNKKHVNFNLACSNIFWIYSYILNNLNFILII